MSHSSRFSLWVEFNILAEDQQHLSDRYSKKNDHELREDDWESGETGLPVLKSPLAIMECRLFQRVDGGNHEILIGQMERAWQQIESVVRLAYHGLWPGACDLRSAGAAGHDRR